jgi:hypothetical protein
VYGGRAQKSWDLAPLREPVTTVSIKKWSISLCVRERGCKREVAAAAAAGFEDPFILTTAAAAAAVAEPLEEGSEGGCGCWAAGFEGRDDVESAARPAAAALRACGVGPAAAIAAVAAVTAIAASYAFR